MSPRSIILPTVQRGTKLLQHHTILAAHSSFCTIRVTVSCWRWMHMFTLCWEKDTGKLLILPSVSLTVPHAATLTEAQQAHWEKLETKRITHHFSQPRTKSGTVNSKSLEHGWINIYTSEGRHHSIRMKREKAPGMWTAPFVALIRVLCLCYLGLVVHVACTHYFPLRMASYGFISGIDLAEAYRLLHCDCTATRE